MKTSTLKIILMLCSFTLAAASVGAAPDPNFHIYLMVGQSNMEGSAPIQEQDKYTHPRVQVLQSQTCGSNIYGTWRPALPTLIRCPRSNGGLGPGDTFGDAMAAATPDSITIGLVGTAYGGARIQYFMPDCGGYCKPPFGAIAGAPNNGTGGYQWVLDLAKKAQQKGVIKGIIFHQGESNSGQSDWPQRVNTFVTALRKDLGLSADDSPFIAGELPYTGCCKGHNTQVNKIPNVVANGHVVSAGPENGQTLDHKGDRLHWNSAAVRVMGKRYAAKMLEVANIEPKDCGTQDGVPVCCNITADPDGDLIGRQNDKMCVVTPDTQGWQEPNPSDVIAAINVGGGASSFDDISYQADKYFAGDGQVYTTPDVVAGANGSEIYNSERYGEFSYNIPVENGDYIVTLGFVELYQTAENTRLFDVVIEDTIAIAGLDVFSKVGHDNLFLSDAFRASVFDGSLDIDINKITNNGTLSSILIRQAPAMASSSIMASSSVQQSSSVAAVSSSAVVSSSSMTITSSSKQSSSTPAAVSSNAAQSSSSESTGVALGSINWQWLCLSLAILLTLRLPAAFKVRFVQ